jgi:hypothetical protein
VIALEGGGTSVAAAANNDGARARSGTPVAVKAVVPADQGPKWSPWLEFGGTYSTDRSRAEAGLFSPLWQSPTSLLFANLRGQLFEESVGEGNFALGMRHMLASGWNLGLWSSYDVRRSTTGNIFHQASFGFEALHPDWDFRLNGYLPITGAKAGGSLTDVQLSGNQIFMVGGREVPLYGADVEAGVKLFGDGRGTEFRLYTGGFWFDGKDIAQRIVGPKARAELRFADLLPSVLGSRLTLESGVRYDEVRRTDWEVGAKLRIPFGGGADRTRTLTAQERRMTEALGRDTDIVTAQSGREAVADARTGVQFDRVAYVGNGGSVTTASAAAGANSLVIANGTISGAQQLAGAQTLQGGSSTIQVRGQTSGAVVGFTAPGAAATLNAPGNAANLTLLGSDTHVAGLSIQGAGSGNASNTGIAVGNNKNNVAITATHVANAGLDGISFGFGNSNVTIAGTSIADTGRYGTSFGGNFSDGGNSNVRIEGTSITGTGSAGLYIGGFNDNVAISGATITAPGTRGILVDFNNSNVTIANSTITGATSYGIDIFSGNDVTIANTTVANAGLSGIHLFQFNTVTLDNSTLAGTFGNNGIFLSYIDNTLNGAGNTAAGASFGGGQLCDSVTLWTGSVVVDGTTFTRANCQ